MQQPPQQSPQMGEENAAYEPSLRSYDDLFPALPESTNQPQNTATNTQWNHNKMRVSLSVITQVFRVPYEERKLDGSQKFGEGESVNTCANIMKDTGAHIEFFHGKDQSLTFLISGKQDKVVNARRKILQHFQKQAFKQVAIPKEHHGGILGKKGERLKELEKQTSTKISIPSVNDASDLIVINGTKEGIEKAEHEIRVMSDQLSKKASERISVPKIYHPFIVGPNNERLNSLIAETGTRINVPPPSVMEDEIFIAGDKEGVAAAKEKIEEIYRLMEKRCRTVSIQVPNTQHKYVIGPKGSTIAEILRETGVSVEMSQVDPDTITLRGPHDRLGLALNRVYEKASSVRSSDVDAPSWIHKYIIGKKGQNIKEITQNIPKVRVEFTDIENKIKIEGPPDEVEKAQEQIKAIADDLISKLIFIEFPVDPKLFKHIIGKNWANVNRLKDEFNVTINIHESGLIRIEGTKEGVAAARKEIEDRIHKLENEKEMDVIIDQRHYRNIIGAKGDKIKEIKERFKEVRITFPGPTTNNDIVKVRGPKEDVDKCVRHLKKLVKELNENSYQIEVPIHKQLHRFIIGKDGAKIREIREETHTEIELPAEGDKNDVIKIIGKKENVEEARERILKIQNERELIVTEVLTISPKLYNLLIGARGQLIHSIMEDCGGVTIKFPSTDSESDKVTIKGVKEDVERARQQLLELVSEKQLLVYTAEVRAKEQHHKFLIGKNGANIKKIRESTGVRIIFPTSNDEDRETITIIGKKEAVEEAKVALQAFIKDIDNITEGEMHVDPRHHKHFVARRGEVLHRIGEECGGVRISFPRSGDDSDRVVLVGAKECIEAAKARINEIIADLESMVTIECVIPQRHHRTVMGAKGHKVQAITSEFDVQIKFPDREEYNTQLNGDANDNPDRFNDTVRPCDIIRITGKEANCLKAKQALCDLIPITLNVDVPFDLHKSIIGQKGRDVKELMSQYDVHIVLSAPDLKEDIIKITGARANVERAADALKERVEELEAEKRERELRSFSLKVEVNPNYHPKIIGKKGSVITKIRKDHDVQITFPKKNDPDEHIITITGYEANTYKARDDIMKIVNELNEQVRVELQIDTRVHSRLIGSKGRNIRKIMDDYKVEIKFPRGDDPDPSLVIVSGNEENVTDAKEHLLYLAEEYLQDVEEQESREKHYTLQCHLDSHIIAMNSSGRNDGTNANGFVVQGGPWEQSNTHYPGLSTGNSPNMNQQHHHSQQQHQQQSHHYHQQQQHHQQQMPQRNAAPNTASVTEFPSFGGRRAEEQPQINPAVGAWGMRR